MAKLRKVARARRPAPRKRASRPRSRARRRRGARSYELQQPQYDLLGLALVAFAVFLGLVLYGNWDGGRVGDWLATGFASLIGQVRFGLPVACAAAGGLLVARPMLPSLRPFRTGAILVLAAAALLFAGGGPTHVSWATARNHGGVLGEA